MVALRETVRRRVLRYFRRHGLLEEHTAEEMLAWEHAGGFSLDASVRIPAHDRAGLERLLRYSARPPFALERLELHQATGDVLYHLTGPTPDGRTVLQLSPLEFLDRLAALVPPPRVHQHRYHGVLAPNSPLRSLVTASAGEEPSSPLPLAAWERSAAPPPSSGVPRTRPVSSRWAALIARIYHTLPLICPRCGEVVIRASGRQETGRFLRGRPLPHLAPPRS